MLNDPAGGAPHSYALSTLQMGVNRPTAAKNDSDSRPDITVVLTDARALDPFILQWVASPGGSAAPSLRATITAEITAPSGPKTPLHCDIEGAQVTMFNMGFQDGSAQVVLSLTAAHLKLNGTQLY